MRWPWQRRAPEGPEATLEATLVFAFRNEVESDALREATEAGMRAARRATGLKGKVRVTADLHEGREARIRLTLRAPGATPAHLETACKAFTRAFRVGYRGLLATREAPEPSPMPAPPDAAPQEEPR